MASWVDMLDYEPESDSEVSQPNVGDVTIQELPSSPGADRQVNNNVDDGDVLDLYGDESESTLSEISECKRVSQSRPGETRNNAHHSVRSEEYGESPRQTNKSKARETERSTVSRQRSRHRRTGAHPSRVHRIGDNGTGSKSEYCNVQRQQYQPPVNSGPAIPVQKHVSHRWNNRWTVRWVRSGFEPLVYDICACNESPNVIFTTLCYRASDVFTMVLKNCNCKRRYWYDQRSKRRRTQIVRDFERAMLWRANAIGRPWSSPGYDLASFVLQHVASDRRCSERRATTPVILVTTNEMLDDPSIGDQLVYRWRTGPRPLEKCAVCRAPSGIVTRDNASTPIFTCWEHSSSQLANSSADRTRMCDTVIVDMQFLHSRENNEYICRLNAIVSDTPPSSQARPVNSVRKVTVAEIVSQPVDADLSDVDQTWANGSRRLTEDVMDPGQAHSTCCQDVHANEEDLFPSMPTGNGTFGGTVKYYDTTIGCTVDKIYCITSKFQK